MKQKDLKAFPSLLTPFSYLKQNIFVLFVFAQNKFSCTGHSQDPEG